MPTPVRRIWKCKACGRQFSVTSGTIFASRKLPIRDYLAAIAIFVNAAKGISALQLGRDLDVQYKTAFVLAHKIREAIGADQGEVKLAGTVEVDGAYFGGHARQSNEKAKRKDRRAAEEQTGKRQSVVVARQREGRTVPVVAPIRRRGSFGGSPNRRGGSRGARRRSTGLGSAARLLRHAPDQPLHRIQFGRCVHEPSRIVTSLGCAVPSGAMHHHISGKYLLTYAREMAWREDTRRQSNGNPASAGDRSGASASR